MTDATPGATDLIGDQLTPEAASSRIAEFRPIRGLSKNIWRVK
jgi:hypothetical protein